MKNKIKLNIDYNNANRVEAFLSEVEEPITIVPFDWQDLKLSSYIGAATKIISTSDKPITMTIFLCTSYSEANEVAKANLFPHSPIAKWGLNGNILYLVESEDPDKVSNVAGIFAGRE